MSVGFLSCRRPATETRVPGQLTMNELMHQGADRAKAREAKWLVQQERASSMTAPDAAKLESELRSDPDYIAKR
jgi:hypothetical protein